jgi:hypothetical protein
VRRVGAPGLRRKGLRGRVMGVHSRSLRRAVCGPREKVGFVTPRGSNPRGATSSCLLSRRLPHLSFPGGPRGSGGPSNSDVPQFTPRLLAPIAIPARRPGGRARDPGSEGGQGPCRLRGHGHRGRPARAGEPLEEVFEPGEGGGASRPALEGPKPLAPAAPRSCPPVQSRHVKAEDGGHRG